MNVLSERGEASLTRANRALAHFRAQVAGSVSSQCGLRSRPGSTIPGVAYSASDAILRLVAIAEEYSTGRFVDLVEAALPAGPHVAVLWDGLLDRGIDTWQQRGGLWHTYFGIKMSAFSQAEPLEGFVDARNAIAHGLGDLTRKQLRKRSKYVGHLRQAGIALAGDTLVIEEGDAERCAQIVKDFISWLDAAA